MKTGLTAVLLLAITLTAQAQIATSHDVAFSFFSKAPIEDISAESEEGVSALDTESKSIYFKVAIRTFEFEKSLMQEHFNENYLESHKYPFAEFKGKIKDDVKLSTDGTYQVTVQGDLTIHNVTKNYTVKGKLKVTGGKIAANATFPVQLADHKIKIPRILIKNIAEVVQVTVSANYAPVSDEAAKVLPDARKGDL
jgi:polyisoprenoid-binding protein YceI